MSAAQRANRVVTFSAAGPQPIDGIVPDIWANDITASTECLTFLAHTPKGEQRIQVGIGGDFNIENALAALAAAELCGASLKEIGSGLANTTVPGRMKIVESADKRITAIVDYAHNELSFTKLFAFLKKQFPEHVWVSVFGVPGDKAEKRRQQLPGIAAEYCDHIIFTEDDPGHERVEDICADLARHLPSGTSYEIVPDRAAAIQHAISWIDAHAGDDCRAILAVLGKGQEATQHRGSEFITTTPDQQVIDHVLATRQAHRATL
ncbi:unnamed protein product [Cylicostephanus goldi]|uniref:Mur ligase C-terminal domain-containing protein n=1 Tax=Cylicostephanus goldi TaxID=71465 RepID=A0A3P6TID5_CYLGO|nr:unnamed protein product [Cylicostephanus goldi]